MTERLNRLIPLIERVDADLYNHGKEGLKTRFETFMADHAATERTQEKMHTQNQARLNWIIALLALLCTILLVIIGWKGLPKTADLLAFPTSSNPVYAATDNAANSCAYMEAMR